jgi:hypothetical protein
LFLSGMLSYGRAPTFLLATGYEQARSIAAFIAGDIEAARRVELDLPQTGVCSSSRVLLAEAEAASSCCAHETPQGIMLCAEAGTDRGRTLLRECRVEGRRPGRTGRMSQVTAAGSAAPAGPAASRPRLVVVSAVGVAQILAWGSSYYLLAVLAGPIAANTGWPLAWVVGALSIGLLVSGLVSPRVGRIIERHGGRPVLAMSAILLAVGLLGLSLAPTLPFFVAAWVVIGFGMGGGLYDPAFSALGRLYGENARSAITQVTLFGGFASTVCWPLTAFLATHLGWRGACLTYAGILIAVVLPLYLFGLPREAERPPQAYSASSTPPGHVRRERRATFVLLAAGFTLAYGIMTVIAV